MTSTDTNPEIAVINAELAELDAKRDKLEAKAAALVASRKAAHNASRTAGVIQAFDHHDERRKTASQRKTEATEIMREAFKADPVWAALATLMRAEWDGQGLLLGNLAASSNGQRQTKFGDGEWKADRPINVFAGVLDTLVKYPKDSEVFAEIVLQAEQDSGYTHTGEPVEQ